MRTRAAGVLVGFGGGAAHTKRTVHCVAVPMASAVADVAAARRDYLDESGGRHVNVIADGSIGQMRRDHPWTPVTNAHIVCRHLLKKDKTAQRLCHILLDQYKTT